MEFMCYSTPQFTGILTQDEREAIRDVMDAPMEDVSRAYDTLSGIWEDYFMRGQPISKEETIGVSDSFRLALNAIWETMTEYAMAVADKDFSGYRPHMQRYQEAILAYEVSEACDKVSDLLRKAMQDKDEEKATNIRKELDTAKGKTDSEAKELLQGIIDKYTQ